MFGMRTNLKRVGSDVAGAEGDAMNINDTALMVVAFACLGIIVGACVFTVELYRELQRGIRKWRVRRELAAVGRPPERETDRLPRVMMRVGLEHRNGSN